MKSRKKQGLTLLELLAVVAIMGIFASIVLISINDARDKARIASVFEFASSVRGQLGDSLVSYWSFDAGDATDDWGDNDGTLGDGICTLGNGSCPDRTTGVIGDALVFDGIDDYVRIGNVLNMGTSDFSISAWVKTSDTPQWSGIVNKYQNDGLGQTGYSLYYGTLASDDYRFVILYQGTSAYATSLNGMTDGEWHHIVGVADRDGDAVVYTDGVAGTPGSITTVTGNIDNGFPFEVGRRFNNSFVFNGTIDEVYIYNQALTTAQIQKLYAEGVERHGIVLK